MNGLSPPPAVLTGSSSVTGILHLEAASGGQKSD